MTSTSRGARPDFELFPVNKHGLELRPGQKARGWFSERAQHCRPLFAANRFGWDFVLPGPLKYRWSGGLDIDDVVILDGQEFASSHFADGTITLDPRYRVQTPPGLHTLLMPVPNQDHDFFTSMSAIVETDVVGYPFFLTIKLTRPGEFTIPAGTPVARIMPVELGMSEDVSIQEIERVEEVWKDEDAIARERDKEPKGLTREYARRMNYPGIRFPEVIKLGERHPNDVLCMPDFLTAQECDKLIEAYYLAPRNSDDKNEFWKDRVSVPDWPEGVEDKLRGMVEKQASEFFGDKLTMTDLHMVRWPEGFEMPEHSDYGGENEYLEREFAAITYLNDDYEGGALHFPALDADLEPKLGMTVVFPGGRMRHAVKKVSKGDRYTVASWLKRGN